MNNQNWRNVNEKTNRDPMSMVMDIESGKIDQAQLMDQIIAHCKASYEEGFANGTGIRFVKIETNGVTARIVAAHPSETADIIDYPGKQEEEIKACKCGSTPEPKRTRGGNWEVQCDAPMCIDGNMTTGVCECKIDSIAAWNNDEVFPF